MQHLDGPVGQKWLKINAFATDNTRKKQAGKVADYICKGMDKASPSEQNELSALVSQIAQLFGKTVSDTTLYISKELQQILDNSLIREQHDLLEEKLKELSKLLITILDVNENDLKRPFNIYAGTSLQGQALIADQIPAIIFSELVEGTKNGIANECLPVQFDGFNGRFAKYAKSLVKSSLYYLDTKMKIKQSSSSKEESELVDAYLKYIDLCMARAILENDQMITPSTKEYLLSTTFKDDLLKLSQEVQGLGYTSIPSSYV